MAYKVEHTDSKGSSRYTDLQSILDQHIDWRLVSLTETYENGLTVVLWKAEDQAGRRRAEASLCTTLASSRTGSLSR
jgi:hypothetical protein